MSYPDVSMDMFDAVFGKRAKEPDITANYHGGNSESKQAHAKVEPSARAMRALILNWVKWCPISGLTCDEIERGCGLKHQTASARISELKRDGLIVPLVRDGQKVRRRTLSGCWAQVYVAVKP